MQRHEPHCADAGLVNRRVLILGARAPVCLEWARAFHASGWRVMAADSLAWPLARFSNTVHADVRLPEPRQDANQWLDAVHRVVQAHGIDLILPTCEEAFYLAHGLDRLRPFCRVMTSDFETMHRLHHKGRFAQLTQGWPVEAPTTRLLESPANVAALADEAPQRGFKPAYSRFASRTLIRPQPKALAHIRPTVEQPWVAQRFVPGREHCSFSLLIEGQLTAHACYHPLYRVGKGSGIYFQPTNPPPIRAFLERFGAETRYTGQVGFDFIESPDGPFHVLECNPRGTSGIHLFSNQPEALVAALTRPDPSQVLWPQPTHQMVGLAMLLFAAPRHALARSWWHDFSVAQDVIARAGDRKPLLGQMAGLLEIIGRAAVKRVGLLAAATSDIEWDGHALGPTPRATADH